MLSILNVIKDGVSFLFSYLNDERADFSKTRLLLLGVSLSYILTIIFTGFKI
jgi:hypothetical protein